MPEKFSLTEALAGLDPAKAAAIKEAWGNMESGFTQASQKAAQYDREKEGWEQERGQYKSALESFNTFFQEWNRQNTEEPGTVRNPGTGRFESRKEAAANLPEAYEPDALLAAIDARLQGFRTEMMEGLNKEKTQFGTEVYTNTGQMLQWERQLQGIKRIDPEADEKTITDLARAKGLRDLNDAYFLAYGRKNMERVAKQAAEQASKQANEEAEKRLRAEFQKTQIEGMSSGAGLSRAIHGTPAPDAPKTKSEAESRAIQDLTARMFAPPTA